MSNHYGVVDFDRFFLNWEEENSRQKNRVMGGKKEGQEKYWFWCIGEKDRDFVFWQRLNSHYYSPL